MFSQFGILSISGGRVKETKEGCWDTKQSNTKKPASFLGLRRQGVGRARAEPGRGITMQEEWSHKVTELQHSSGNKYFKHSCLLPSSLLLDPLLAEPKQKPYRQKNLLRSAPTFSTTTANQIQRKAERGASGE